MTKLRRNAYWGVMMAVFAAGRLLAADANATNETAASAPVFVPDMTHANESMPDGVLNWNSQMLSTNADADQSSVRFTFSFTNVARQMEVLRVTSVIRTARAFVQTNVATVTNFTPVSVTILDAHASCGCTQPELPPRPWTIPPGGKGEFSATVNLHGPAGTMIKSITVSTDKGSKELYMRITILPPVVPVLSDAERARDLEIAKADRQAIFKTDCATCHAKSIDSKYGQSLYDAVCGICHDAEHRAAVVPDLHELKTPTNEEFWRTWIAHGKAGSLMPAFSTTDGGPLTDMQIGTLAAYLNATHPSKSAPPAPAR